jgi:hypothetical protein
VTVAAVLLGCLFLEKKDILLEFFLPRRNDVAGGWGLAVALDDVVVVVRDEQAWPRL